MLWLLSAGMLALLDAWDPTGEKARAVKAQYQGLCGGCGAPTLVTAEPWLVILEHMFACSKPVRA
jgi:hypothetical protein